MFEEVKEEKEESNSESETDLICPQAPRHPTQGEPEPEPEDGEISPEQPRQPDKDTHASYQRQWKGVSNISAYELKAKVGEGTFGIVTIATHIPTGKTVALKTILIHNEKEGMPITAIREIRILKMLNHQNIINLQEVAYQKKNTANKECRGSSFLN
jgi:serine/threonine protein kinase